MNKEQSLVRKTSEIKTITYIDLNMKQILRNTGNFNYLKFVTALKNMTYALDINMHPISIYLYWAGIDYSQQTEITHVNIGNF